MVTRRLPRVFLFVGALFIMSAYAATHVHAMDVESPFETSKTFVKLVSLEGKEDQLLDFTLEVMKEIKEVDGLVNVEVNQDEANGNLYLYYTWESREMENAYVKSKLYSDTIEKLKQYIDEEQKSVTQLKNLYEPPVKTLVKLVPHVGQEDQLVEFTLGVMKEIRKVDGLVNVDVNQDKTSGDLYLYYTWESREKESTYVESELCQGILEELEGYIIEDEKLLIQLSDLNKSPFTTFVKIVPHENTKDELAYLMLQFMVHIKEADGLLSVEVNQDEKNGDLYLYYTWESREKESTYLMGGILDLFLDHFANTYTSIPLRNQDFGLGSTTYFPQE